MPKKRKQTSSPTKPTKRTTIDDEEADYLQQELKKYSASQIKQGEKRLPSMCLEFKLNFENMRKETLDSLSTEYKSKFGQNCYAKWNRTLLPALILSPFAVPNSEPRLLWFQAYDNVKATNRLEHLSYIVYWYGARETSHYYSLIPQKDIFKESKAMQVVLDKFEKGKTLTTAQKEMYTAYKEMLENESVPQADRRGAEKEWKEDHEAYTVLDAIDNLLANPELIDGDDDDAETNLNDTAVNITSDDNVTPVKKKKKNAKKEETGEGTTSTKKKKRKKSVEHEQEVKVVKKRGRKSNVEMEAIVQQQPEPAHSEASADDEAGATDMKITNGSNLDAGDDNNVDKKAKIASPVNGGNLIDDIGDADMDESDEEVKALEDPIPSSDEKDDEDYDEGAAKKVETTPKSSKKGKEKKVKNKKEKAETDKARQRRLKKEFQEDEKRYADLIERWTDALNNDNVSELKKCVGEVDGEADELSFHFIEIHIGDRLKDTKKVYKLHDMDVDTVKQVMAKLKENYAKKKPDIPKGLKMSPSLPLYKTGEKKVKREETQGVKTEPISTPKQDGASNDKSIGDTPAAVDDSDVKVKAEDDTKTMTMEVSVPRRDGKVNNSPAPSVPTKVKTERKKFSLGDLMRPSREQSGGGSQQHKARSDPNKPSWIFESTAIAKPNEDKDRMLALEFFKDMASQFPSNARVNVESMALSLEKSIYEWAIKRPHRTTTADTEKVWLDQYWDKVHEIVASICGKHPPGSLMGLIVDGKFASANELVNLPEQTMMDSFQGKILTEFT